MALTVKGIEKIEKPGHYLDEHGPASALVVDLRARHRPKLH
jgi:hypothetical protein